MLFDDWNDNLKATASAANPPNPELLLACVALLAVTLVETSPSAAIWFACLCVCVCVSVSPRFADANHFHTTSEGCDNEMQRKC